MPPNVLLIARSAPATDSRKASVTRFPKGDSGSLPRATGVSRVTPSGVARRTLTPSSARATTATTAGSGLTTSPSYRVGTDAGPRALAAQPLVDGFSRVQ